MFVIVLRQLDGLIARKEKQALKAQVESSLERIEHWPGFRLERLQALGHDIGQREATLLGDFLKAHAEDRIFKLVVVLVRGNQQL